MKSAITFVLFALTMNLLAQEFRLPFNGRWFVAQGGDTPNVNQHMRVRAQWYAIDFVKVGGSSQRALTKTDGSKIEDFYSWGETVLSPVAGEVESVIDNLPDNPLGIKDATNPAGNYIILKSRRIVLYSLRIYGKARSTSNLVTMSNPVNFLVSVATRETPMRLIFICTCKIHRH